jgi:hypothetical protein
MSSDASSELAPEANVLSFLSLRDAISTYKATFTCGGVIPIDSRPDRGLGIGTQPVSSPPVVIRWSSNDASSSDRHTIEFPVAADEPQHLEKLLRDCAPATFGVDGKNVLDDSYRKAAKMDNTQFCTNFVPHDCGIIDTIAQVLLPTVDVPASEKNISTEHLGVVAALYKLNVSIPLFLLIY